MLLLAAVLGVASLVVRWGRTAGAPALPPAVVDEAMRGGVSVGDTAVPPSALVFFDYQCEACALVHQLLEDLLAEHPSGLHLVFQHYPMPAVHAEAVAAASAAYCADLQGQFLAMHRALLLHQARVGQVPWRWFADQAELADQQAFERCLGDPATEVVVVDARRRARGLGVKATPAAVVAGRLIHGPAIIDSILARLD